MGSIRSFDGRNCEWLIKGGGFAVVHSKQGPHRSVKASLGYRVSRGALKTGLAPVSKIVAWLKFREIGAESRSVKVLYASME